jgi:hypothetical protein
MRFHGAPLDTRAAGVLVRPYTIRAASNRAGDAGASGDL